MNVLWLGDAWIPRFLMDEIWLTRTAGPIELQDCRMREIDFIVSHNYHFKIPADVVAEFYKRCVNLHTSILPWNRGADPNFWSWYDGTPKGASLHYVDNGFDTGPVIGQEELELDPEASMFEIYKSLNNAARGLLEVWWPRLREGEVPAEDQDPDEGSAHRRADLPCLVDWTLPARYVIELGHEHERHTGRPVRDCRRCCGDPERAPKS